MNILVICEYSNIVSQAFREKGHYVLSCDLLPNLSPQANHYIGDYNDLLHYDWDFIIGFTPCTFLANAQIFRLNRCHLRMSLALYWVSEMKKIMNNKCPTIVLENPIGFANTHWRKPNQIISPHLFGSQYSKDICLWTKNLPPLMFTCMSSGKKKVSNHVNSRMSQALKSKIKSKFFPEVAFEMANQWG